MSAQLVREAADRTTHQVTQIVHPESRILAGPSWYTSGCLVRLIRYREHTSRELDTSSSRMVHIMLYPRVVHPVAQRSIFCCV